MNNTENNYRVMTAGEFRVWVAMQFKDAKRIANEQGEVLKEIIKEQQAQAKNINIMKVVAKTVANDKRSRRAMWAIIIAAFLTAIGTTVANILGG